MNIRLLIAGLALGLLAAGGCAAGPKVLTDFDPSAEFSAFRTFAFSGMTDRGRGVGQFAPEGADQGDGRSAAHRQGIPASRRGRPFRPAGPIFWSV